MHNRKVMVIDDAQIDRYIADKLITRCGFASEIIAFESGPVALKFLKSCRKGGEIPPDVILLDINMPEMNGFEFLDEYAGLPEEVKSNCNIVMLSSSVHPDDRKRALESQYVCTFISKPLNAEKLAELERAMG